MISIALDEMGGDEHLLAGLIEVSRSRGVVPSSCSIFLVFRTRCVRCWAVSSLVVGGGGGKTILNSGRVMIEWY